MGFDVILLNAVIHIVTFIYAFVKAKQFNLYVFVWLAYSFVTLMGYFCVIWNMHYTRDVNLGYKVAIEPYVFSYLTTLLLTQPLKRIKITIDNLSFYSSQIFYIVSLVVFILFLFQSTVNGIRAYVIYTTIGMGEAYDLSHEGISINIFGSDILERLVNISSVVTEAFAPIYIVYYLSRMVKRKGKLYVNLFFVVVAFLPNVLSAFASGSKAGLFFTLFAIIFYYVIFNNLFNEITKRYLRYIGIIIIVFFLSGTLSIVTQRLENDSQVGVDKYQTQTHIVHYLGESYPNLGAYFYGHVKEHPNGRRFFPEFFFDNAEKHYLGKGIYSKFDYWNYKTKVNMAIFKTFWGDWYVEFGLYGSFFAIILVFLFFKYICFNSMLSISSLPILYFYYNYILIHGCFAGSGLEGSLKHRLLLVCILSSFLIRYIEKKRIGSIKFIN